MSKAQRTVLLVVATAGAAAGLAWWLKRRISRAAAPTPPELRGEARRTISTADELVSLATYRSGVVTLLGTNGTIMDIKVSIEPPKTMLEDLSGVGLAGARESLVEYV